MEQATDIPTQQQPRFKARMTTVSSTQNGVRVGAPAYEIIVEKRNVRKLIGMLGKVTEQSGITVVNYSYKHLQPQDYFKAVLSHQQHLQKHTKIVVDGLHPTNLAKNIQQLKNQFPKIQKICTTSMSEKCGRYLLICHQEDKESITKELQENLQTWYNSIKNQTTLNEENDFPPAIIVYSRNTRRTSSDTSTINSNETGLPSIQSMVSRFSLLVSEIEFPHLDLSSKDQPLPEHVQPPSEPSVTTSITDQRSYAGVVKGIQTEQSQHNNQALETWYSSIQDFTDHVNIGDFSSY
jgi:hypothetical protein